MKLLLLIITFIGASPTFAKGGLGRQLPPSYGQEDDRHDIRQWCHMRLRILERAKSHADRFYRVGDFQRATMILSQGLIDALSDVTDSYEYTLTTTTLRRGITLYERLAMLTDGSEKDHRVMSYFLYEYYKFIHTVAHQIDIPYYHFDRCRWSCHGQNHREFERKILETSDRQYQMILSTFSSASSDRWGRHTIHPMGSSKFFLNALELALDFRATDLSSLLNATQYACLIDDIRYLHSLTQDYNYTGIGYENDFWAVQHLGSKAYDLRRGSHHPHCY